MIHYKWIFKNFQEFSRKVKKKKNGDIDCTQYANDFVFLYLIFILYIFYKYVSYIIKPIHRQHNYWLLITIHLTHSFLIHSKYFTKLYLQLFPHLKLCKFSILSLFSPRYFCLILYETEYSFPCFVFVGLDSRSGVLLMHNYQCPEGFVELLLVYFR